MRFDFATDARSQQFCEEVLRLMTERYMISEEEAYLRLAVVWKELPFKGEDDIRYHDPVDFWADHLFRYYDYNRTGDARFHPLHGENPD